MDVYIANALEQLINLVFARAEKMVMNRPYAIVVRVSPKRLSRLKNVPCLPILALSSQAWILIWGTRFAVCLIQMSVMLRPLLQAVLCHFNNTSIAFSSCIGSLYDCVSDRTVFQER